MLKKLIRVFNFIELYIENCPAIFSIHSQCFIKHDVIILLQHPQKMNYTLFVPRILLKTEIKILQHDYWCITLPDSYVDWKFITLLKVSQLNQNVLLYMVILMPNQYSIYIHKTMSNKMISGVRGKIHVLYASSRIVLFAQCSVKMTNSEV